jgi:RNA polymerase sigma factor (sigma-70 family)
MGIQDIMNSEEVSCREDTTLRVIVPLRRLHFEVSMELDSIEPTSTTLLDRVGLSPNDQVAWARFVDLYGSRILGWCRQWGLQAADSEDVTQDVLLRLAQKLRAFQYDPSRSFRGWLRTVTQNALADFLADRKRQCSGSGDDDVLEQLQSVQARDDLVEHLKDQFDAEVVAVACARARARVEPQTWEAFRLTAYEDLSGDDVAARLGMTRATVFKARSRVLGFIREEIKQLDEP